MSCIGGSAMTEFFRKFKWLLKHRRKEDELIEELQCQLHEEARERRAERLPEQDARMSARREFGNISLLREDVRAAWGWTLIEQFVQDLRYAFRMMTANKLFS